MTTRRLTPSHVISAAAVFVALTFDAGANADGVASISTLDADALNRIIHAVEDRGYGFVTLDALLR